MRRHGWGILCGMVGLLLAAPVLAAGADGATLVLDRVVASVNDEAITLSEIQEEGQPVIRKIYKEFVGDERERRAGEAQQQLLDELIERRLLMQVARREGMLPAPAEVQGAIDDLKKANRAADDAQFRALLKAEGLTMELVRRTVTERLAIGRVLNRQVRSSLLLSEVELTQHYAANREKYQRKAEAEIRLIFVSIRAGRDDAAARARAEEALARLRSGADFAEIAREYSDSPTRERGGQLGVVHRGDLAPEIEAVAFSLPAGGVSDPVRTSAGWNILRVERAQDESVVPFAEARDAIRDELFAQKFEAKQKEYVAGLRARASIQIMVENPELPKP